MRRLPRSIGKIEEQTRQLETWVTGALRDAGASDKVREVAERIDQIGSTLADLHNRIEHVRQDIRKNNIKVVPKPDQTEIPGWSQSLKKVNN